MWMLPLYLHVNQKSDYENKTGNYRIYRSNLVLTNIYCNSLETLEQQHLKSDGSFYITLSMLLLIPIDNSFWIFGITEIQYLLESIEIYIDY